MAIIVDKEQKRKDIALSCKNLFVENCINDITVVQIAKTAGVGKGTVYDYFNNKEEILFGVVNILMLEHNELKEAKLQKANTTKEKVKVFFDFYYDEENETLRKLYKQFLSITLSSPREDMIEFQTMCFSHYYNWLEEIIKDGINSGELKPETIHLKKGLFSFGDGIFISSLMTKDIISVKQDINEYLDALFNLIEVKDDK